MNEATKFISHMAHVTTFCVRKAIFFCNEFHFACICFVTVICRSLSKLNTLHGWREKHFKWGMEWSEVGFSSILQLCSWMVSSWLFTMFTCYKDVPWLQFTHRTTKENLEIILENSQILSQILLFCSLHLEASNIRDNRTQIRLGQNCNDQ